MQLRLTLGLAMFAGFAFSIAPVNAESVKSVALSAKQKSAIVGFMKARIQRHESMTSDEIIRELSDAARKNPLIVKSREVEKVANQGIDRLKSLGDKDAIVALEKIELQRVMSSGNYIFALTQGAWNDCYNPSGAQMQQQCYEGEPLAQSPELALFLTIFSIPLDIALLVPELLLCFITGF